MVNTDDFIKRLTIVMEFYSLSSSAFADRIGVQRSGLSHLLSGRNKPSLDFIMKIIEAFPEIDLYWILNGRGIFPPVSTSISEAPIEEKKVIEVNFEHETKQKKSEPVVIPNPIVGTASNVGIEKIVVFYRDGTFSEYQPK